jgi:hypothetical protein
MSELILLPGELRGHACSEQATWDTADECAQSCGLIGVTVASKALFEPAGDYLYPEEDK